ncbi:MAG: hypothetical protein ABIJ21_04440 [Nanoarchaeota archaeon]
MSYANNAGQEYQSNNTYSSSSFPPGCCGRGCCPAGRKMKGME